MNKDKNYLRHAIRLAKEAHQIGNLPIGAVIVLNDKVIAKGKNSIWVPRHRPNRHAEIEALEAVPSELWGRAQEMTLYSTLEPCVMCAGTILLSHIGRVVWGAGDERGGSSVMFSHMPPAFEQLLQATEWVGPALPQECNELNRMVAQILMERNII